jgi:hypothetical protein
VYSTPRDSFSLFRGLLSRDCVGELFDHTAHMRDARRAP